MQPEVSCTIFVREREHVAQFGGYVTAGGYNCVAAPTSYGTTRILTFDQKHFRAVKPSQGGVFTVLPADL